jgi:hypothetical protein
VKTFEVKTRFTFTGSFFITAENREEARRQINDSCGLVLGRTIHTSLPEETVDWDFPSHPEKVIMGVKRTTAEVRFDGYQF